MDVTLRMRHVNRSRGRNGQIYYYHRPTGIRLPDDPHSAEFMKKVEELNAPKAVVEGTAPGSLADLITAYKADPDFTSKAHKTRKDYSRYLDFLSEKFGDLMVWDIDREFVLELRSALSAKKRTADYTLQVLSKLMSFAVDRPRRFRIKLNPVLKFGRLSDPEGYKPWPDNLIAAARQSAYPELRWVIDGALYTAQRGEDLVAFAWPHYDGKGISVKQEKGGDRLWLPAHPVFKKMLDGEIKKRAAVIFTSKTGRPWKLDHLRHEIAELVADCGFAGYSLHGLRKNASNNLAEAGASDHEIRAVTGHKTLQMVQLYTREANQKRMATAAIAKLPRKRKRHKLQNTR